MISDLNKNNTAQERARHRGAFGKGGWLGRVLPSRPGESGFDLGCDRRFWNAGI